jgi:hypothetical protein
MMTHAQTDSIERSETTQPIRVGSGVLFGVFWCLTRATDGGWWTTKKAGRMTYKLALCRMVSNDGIKLWIAFAGPLKFYLGKKGQKPSAPNTQGQTRSARISNHE